MDQAANRSSKARQGLLQYIGALLSDTDGFTSEESGQLVVASLLEEAVKLCQSPDNTKYNFFIAKPILRAVVFLIEARREELLKEAPPGMSQKIIDTYKPHINFLKTFIDSIQQKENESKE